MAQSMKLGGGGRFAKVEREARKSGAKNPAAVAASIGIKKYGKTRMSRMAAAARERKGGLAESDPARKARAS